MLEKYHAAGVDLGKLIVFVAVAETLSFRKGAERLGQAQPAVSRQIQTLEAALGCRLFERDTRGTRLTEAGSQLLERLPGVFDGMGAALDRTRAAAAGKLGRLRIGCSITSINTYLPGVFARFRERYPDVEIEMVEFSSAAQLEALKRGDLDCCFLLAVADELGVEFVARELFEEAVGLVLPLEHPMAESEAVDPAILGSLPYLCFPRERNPDLHDRLLEFFEKKGLSVSRGAPIGSRLQAVGRVGAGMGFTTLTKSFSFICGATTVFRPMAGSGVPKVRHRFVWRKGETSPLVRNFRAGLEGEVFEAAAP